MYEELNESELIIVNDADENVHEESDAALIRFFHHGDTEAQSKPNFQSKTMTVFAGLRFSP
jgi:hypothetical protein